MAIFDFFSKRSKPEGGILQKKIQADEEFFKKFLERFDSLEKIALAVDNRQKEMIIQLEELDASINEDTKGHLEQLMSLSDIIYDFFSYSKKDESIAEQAKMMWLSSKAVLMKAGIEVLEPTCETFNHLLHIAHDTTSQLDIPDEYVYETLKCGYVFGEQILRRATVVVNKTNGGSSHDSRH